MSYINATNDGFDGFLKAAGDKPVLVDFWATWCNPCRMLAPIFEELTNEYEGKALFGKVNVDDEQALAQRFHVRSIPTLILFKNGEAVDKSIGLGNAAELKAMLDKAL